MPENATNKEMSWTSSNPAVAQVRGGTYTISFFGTPSETRPGGKIIPTGHGTSIITVTAVSNATARSVVAVLPERCGTDTPGWGVSLGTVGFASNKIWEIGNQVWSDAVTASACNKTSFHGGYRGSFSRTDYYFMDCRSNPNFPGDLFSWCAVIGFGNQLCPEPWRVPTRQDFINLDIALGGNGQGCSNNSAHFTKYINIWGASYGGEAWRDRGGSLHGQGRSAYYWSKTEQSDNSWDGGHGRRAHCLTLFSSGMVFTQGLGTGKDYGHALRCVRNVE